MSGDILTLPRSVPAQDRTGFYFTQIGIAQLQACWLHLPNPTRNPPPEVLISLLEAVTGYMRSGIREGCSENGLRPNEVLGQFNHRPNDRPKSITTGEIER